MTEVITRRYKIGNAKNRPQVGSVIRVPHDGCIKRAVVIDITQDDVLVCITTRKQ